MIIGKNFSVLFFLRKPKKYLAGNAPIYMRITVEGSSREMSTFFTQGFKYTQNHRQLISFAGLASTQYSSGTSIQGKPRIYKRGGKNLRDVLYMCSMNAMKTNTTCKALYDRLRANEKTGKQALVAVMNKLLKQVFAVVKNNCLYQPNYCSAKP